MADAAIIGDHQIGAFALRNFAAIRERKRPRGIARRQLRCARQSLRIGFGEFEDAVAGGAPHARKGEAASDGVPAAVDGGDDRDNGTAFGVALPDLTFMLPRSGTDGGSASRRGAVDLDGGGV
jgi:hypothetical protein